MEPANLGAIIQDLDAAAFDSRLFDNWRQWLGEKGIWKNAPENLVLYNQRQVDPSSCTYMATITALSNMAGSRMPQDAILSGFRAFAASGRFTPGVGALIEDGVRFGTDAFNEAMGTKFSPYRIPFQPQQIVDAFKSGSAVVGGLRFGTGYIAQEQANGDISSVNPSLGNFGHAVAWVKINTMGGFLMKYLETYAGETFNGKPFKDVILADYVQDAVLFQNNGWAFSR